jgi:NAD(P)-dependent dehydrogenase (short-subunit alcohol dehydrogenase family)
MITSETLKSVVITGASSGIGRACALRLDKLGWQVFAGVRQEAAGAELCRQASARFMPVLLDVGEPNSIAAAAIVKATVGQAGLAGLVNNAGIGTGGPLEILPIAELRRSLEVNVIGQIAVTQAFLPLLRKGRGRIVNMGSISGRVAMPGLGPYAASKFALEALTDALRVELSPWGLSVSIIEPGPIDTPIWAKSLATADNLTQTWPPQAFDLYGQAIKIIRQAIVNSSRQAAPVNEVVRAVTHALSAKRPHTRYPVGRGMGLTSSVLPLLPDRLRDWVIIRQRVSPPHS